MLCFFVVRRKNKILEHSCSGLPCRRGNSIILWSCTTGAHLVSGWARPACNLEGSLPLLLTLLCHDSQRLLGYCCYQTVNTKFWSSNDAEEHWRRAISHFHCRQSTSHTAMLAVKLYECFCWCYSTPTASIRETYSLFLLFFWPRLVLLCSKKIPPHALHCFTTVCVCVFL